MNQLIFSYGTRWLFQVFILILVIFAIQKYIPQDAAALLLVRQGIEPSGSERYEKRYQEARTNLGLDGPVFYFSVQAKASDQFHLPAFAWNGSQNQFHRWFTRLFSGKAAVSNITGQNIFPLIGNALLWTVPISAIALFIVYFVSKYLARYLKSHNNKWLEGLLFFFYSIPLIWFALLILLFFTNDYFGIKVFDVGVQYGSLGFGHYINRILPVIICLSFTDIAYLTSVYGSSIDIENKKPYFKTALSKGLSAEDATKWHTAPNALLSMITLFVGAIPGSIAGSVVLETIFNIPGIGRLLYTSLKQGDYQVLMYIVLLIGILTSLFYAIGDYYITRINPSAKK